MTRLRSPLALARGLGSTHEGVHHWLAQRLTAIALVPLLPWLVVSLATLPSFEHAAVVAWIASPVHAALLIALIAALLYHAELGIRVVLEDYAHLLWARIAALVAVRLAFVLMGIVACLSILQIALRAS
jgi:succinate dehydrogenase / fumarate reductase membrane anchor subunit